MKKIKLNKKAQQTQFAKISTAIIVMLVVALAIYGMVRFGVVDTLKNIIPGFGISNGTKSSDDSTTRPETIKITELCDRVKSEITLSNELKQSLINSINHNYEVHIECGATNKAKPIIYLSSKERSNFFMRWDYIKKEMVILSSEPSIHLERILRTLADLENSLGIKAA